jgi:hypothetical protein
MSRTSAPKATLAKLQKQNRARKERAAAPPEEEKPPEKDKITSYSMPVKLLEDLHTTKQHLQVATKDRRTYNASMIVRAALDSFVTMEMEDQIALVSGYAQRQAKAVG